MIISDFFSSPGLAIIIFAVIVLIAAIGLFFPSFLFFLFLPAALLFINLMFCTGKRLRNNLFAGKKNIRQAGIYLIHVSIILILAAAAIGHYRGWSTSLQIKEHETINISDKIKNISLPVSLRCEKFSVDYYDNHEPKDFRARLTFASPDGSTSSTISVNRPVKFSGVNFYLADYGQLPGKAILTIKKNNRIIRQADAASETEIKAGSLKIDILRIEEDANGFGPAVKIRTKAGTKQDTLWIFQNIEQMQKRYPRMLQDMPLLNPALLAPYLFSFNLEKGETYIVLDIKHAPEVPLAAAGAIGLFAGILLVLIFRRSGKLKSHNQPADKEGNMHD